MPVSHPTTTNRVIARLGFKPGQTVVESVETGAIIKKSMIRLRMTVTQNSGRTMFRKGFGKLLNIIRRFEIKINEEDTVVTLDGKGLYLMSQRDFGIDPLGFDELPLLSSPEPQEIEMYIPIAHFLPRALGPLRTALDLRGARNCHYSIEWEADPVAALYREFYGDEKEGISIDNVQCEIIADFIGNLPEGTPRALIRQLKFKTQPIITDDAHWEFEIGRGNGTYLKSVVVLQTRGGHATLASGNYGRPAIFTGNLAVAAGEQVFKDVPPAWYVANEHSVNQYDAPWGVIPIEFADMFDTGQMLNMNELDSDLVLRGPVDGTKSEDKAALLSIYTDCVRAPRWAGA